MSSEVLTKYCNIMYNLDIVSLYYMFGLSMLNFSACPAFFCAISIQWPFFFCAFLPSLEHKSSLLSNFPNTISIYQHESPLRSENAWKKPCSRWLWHLRIVLTKLLLHSQPRKKKFHIVDLFKFEFSWVNGELVLSSTLPLRECTCYFLFVFLTQQT